MCTVTTASGAFDPQACPLLRGLSPAEMERKIARDPRIRACLDTLADGTVATDPKVTRLITTYRARSPERSSGAPPPVAVAACTVV
jgi:hypothetical protein